MGGGTGTGSEMKTVLGLSLGSSTDNYRSKTRTPLSRDLVIRLTMNESIAGNSSRS